MLSYKEYNKLVNECIILTLNKDNYDECSSYEKQDKTIDLIKISFHIWGFKDIYNTKLKSKELLIKNLKKRYDTEKDFNNFLRIEYPTKFKHIMMESHIETFSQLLFNKLSQL